MGTSAGFQGAERRHTLAGYAIGGGCRENSTIEADYFLVRRVRKFEPGDRTRGDTPPPDLSGWRKLTILAVIPAMAFVAYWPLLLAWADHLSRSPNAETVARGVRLSPDDSDFRMKLATAQQSTGADATAALEAAAAQNPGNADAWIRLGLAAEMRGDMHTAESRLLEAAHVSHQFAPRWALANYYFRRRDPAHFWPWARESLLMGYGDLNPVFRLCWEMSQDAGLIFERAIPERRAVLNAYVFFLMQAGRLAASEPAAAKLARLATLEERSTLVAWCDRQLGTGAFPSTTLDVWNTACARRLLPFAPLDRDRAPLTDGGFAVEFTGGGFAWSLVTPPGVSIGRNQSPRYLWVAFNGDQPETCAPLLQFVPVIPGASYRLRFDYHTSELPPDSGLRWSVFDARTGIDLATLSGWLWSTDWKLEELRFTAPATGLVRVTLTCHRLPGAARVEGSVELRGMSMERES